MGAGYDERLPSLKPFMFVETHARRGSVGVIAFGAYDAYGLIGTEKGGVAIVIEPPAAAVLATKAIPWKPDGRVAVAERLLKAKTAAGVVRRAVNEGGFEWRVDARRAVKALVRGEATLKAGGTTSAQAIMGPLLSGAGAGRGDAIDVHAQEHGRGDRQGQARPDDGL